MKFASLFCLAVVGALTGTAAHAILPLPYPNEPANESSQVLQQEVKDPKSIQGYYELYSASRLREKELPSFDNGADVLGYVPGETFVVTPDLQSRVGFWKKIFSEYNSTQAVLHDADYPEIVYGVVDIAKYVADDNVPYRKKMRALNKYLKAEKEIITKKLTKLHMLRDNPVGVPLELFPLFKQFEKITEENKFRNASKRVRAQVGQRDRLVRGFLYGGRYFDKMMEIFEKKKLPKEITRLPLVESGFNLAARSKVGASGVWQFMRSTGKMFMRVDKSVDERNDPISATWAAAELLRQNYEALGSWPLAITAYNHGREGMARAARQLSTKDMGTIIKNYQARTFGFASANFYCEFLAVLEVEREYRKYFGKLVVDSPLRMEEFSVPDDSKFEDLAEACRMSDRELAVLNPALTDFVVSGRGTVPRGYLLKVPPEKAERCRSGSRNLTLLNAHSVKKG